MHAKEQRGLVNMRRTRQSKNKIQEKQMILLDVLGFIETYKWNSNVLKQAMSWSICLFYVTGDLMFVQLLSSTKPDFH